MTEYRHIRYLPTADEVIVRIELNRPETRNAQHRGLLVELDRAFAAAEANDAVRVVILGAAGPSFSSGHDLGSKAAIEEATPGPGQHPSFAVNGGTRQAVERRTMQEAEHFFRDTLRWRDLRKITIAEVKGVVYAAGLMLMWACDLIVAADDTRFADVVATRLGMNGVEFFAHPWELGPRRAKELLLTGDALDADEAHRIGMVNKVFPAQDLAQRTDALARRIAKLPTITALLVKESVNQSVDAQGFRTALAGCFSLHQLNHAHWAELHGSDVPVATAEDGVPDWRSASPVKVATKDET
jgi:enoyl-CoA hydratase